MIKKFACRYTVPVIVQDREALERYKKQVSQQLLDELGSYFMNAISADLSKPQRYMIEIERRVSRDFCGNEATTTYLTVDDCKYNVHFDCDDGPRKHEEQGGPTNVQLPGRRE